jgi:tripartite ATP-independent transporter DctP family solute receptor
MKKGLSILLCLVLAFSLMVGCGTEAGKEVKPEPEPQQEEVETVTMKFAGTAAADMSNGEYLAMLKFEELVEEYSNGIVQVEVYPASQLGTSTEFTEGVSLGTVECAMAGFDGIAQYAPQLNAFSMPYQYASIEEMRSVIEGDTECRKAIDETMGGVNMKMVGVCYRPFRVVANNKKPVKDPATLQGVTLRVPDAASSQAILQAMGAVTATIAWSEVYTSIQQGVIDGCENAITELVTNNIHETVKYISETRHMSAGIPIFVCKNWFDKLSKDQQDAIIKAGEEVTEWRYDNVSQETEECWEKCEELGIEVIYFDDIDIDAFRAATADVYKDFVSKGLFTEEFYLSTLPDNN